MSKANYKRDKRSPIPKSEKVSALMSKIKGTNTKPEVLFRAALYAAGLRGYRLNYKSLPGKPDVVFTRQKVAIFINGCYWHGCEACGWKPPKHNTEYWVEKITKNRARDAVKIADLQKAGYNVITVWEHEIKKTLPIIVDKIKSAL